MPGCPGKGRHYRVQPWDELGQNDKQKPIPGKGLFRPAIVGVRVSREAVNEVQDLVTRGADPPRTTPSQPAHRQ